MWHYHEAVTPSGREKHRCARGKKSFSTARGRDSSMVMPHPLLGWQMKAEIKGFLLRYRLLQYKHWFSPIFELKDFPEYTVTPCTLFIFDLLSWNSVGTIIRVLDFCEAVKSYENKLVHRSDFFVLPWISRMLRRQNKPKNILGFFCTTLWQSNDYNLFRLICYMSRVVFFRFRKSSHVSRNVCSKAGRSNQLNA
mgnify:CR=1 FL=1